MTTSIKAIPSKPSYVVEISRKLSTIHIVCLFLLYLVFNWFVAGPGMLHREMDVRLPAHISGKPILQIIFDANSMNIGGWEARQLSFLFDVIDGNFVALCIRLGIPHFRSLTHVVFTLVIMLYMWTFLTRILKLDRLVSLLLIALLLTTPSFIYTYYYRTSKIGVTLCVTILLCEIYKVIKGNIYIEIKNTKPIWLTLEFLIITLSLMLFDLLGGFFASVIITYLFLASLHKPDSNRSASFIGMFLGYSIWVLYFLYLGPLMMTAITGQKADTTYLTGAPLQYFFGFLFLAMPGFIADMIRYLFGYISQTGGGILLLLAFSASIWLTIPSRKNSGRIWNAKTTVMSSKRQFGLQLSKLKALIARFEPLLTMIFVISGIALIYTLLVTRHAPILWPDVRPTYYIMPAQAVLLFTTAILLARPRIKWGFKFPVIHFLSSLLLVFFLLGNIRGSIQIKSVLFSGDNLKLFPHDTALLHALADLNKPEFKPTDNIASDPIYKLFSTP